MAPSNQWRQSQYYGRSFCRFRLTDGAQEQCQALGQTFAGFSSLRTPMNAGKYVSMEPFPLRTKLWAFASRIKAATIKCGYIWFSLTITAAMKHLIKHEQRLLLKRRSAPYQHNKERCKADEDESDRSLSSKAQATIRFRHNSHTGNAPPMSTVEGTHDAVHHALRSVTG